MIFLFYIISVLLSTIIIISEFKPDQGNSYSFDFIINTFAICLIFWPFILIYYLFKFVYFNILVYIYNKFNEMLVIVHKFRKLNNQ